METPTYSMKTWTSDELVGEVVRRAAADGPALRLVEGVIIRARLAAADSSSVATEFPPVLVPALWPDGVRGTTEMGLADVVEGVGVLVGADHEVEAAWPNAHTHDHSHGKKAPVRLAAHEHPHVHAADGEADADLNGHIHARTHARLPWEQASPD